MTQEELSKLPDMLEMGALIEFVTHGAWSLHHLVEKVIEKTGPADVQMSTWAITEKPLRVLERLKSTGKILSLSGIIERKISHHNPKAFGFVQQVFDSVELSKCHAKVTLITNADWQVAIVCSANWTVNRRTEVGTILCNPESVEFHKSWMNGEDKE
ncbi:hypothetical protein [Jiulongibacter sediminis]|uniref:hypothetical protein n=1 Tax=Jiulongibacter sediminis TaxID=1605367 RepID=UPI0026EB5410|nr:hypothetical protein [Jiulongibacter sediminis]